MKTPKSGWGEPKDEDEPGPAARDGLPTQAVMRVELSCRPDAYDGLPDGSPDAYKTSLRPMFIRLLTH
jgi:hypothetical protein